MAKRQNLNAILEMIEQAADLDEVAEALGKFRDLLALDHVVYRWMDSAGRICSCSTLPTAWRERYREKRYHRVDPVVIGCYTAFNPVDWRDLDWSTRLASAYRKDALAYGVGSQGLSVPVRGPCGQYAVFSVNKTCEDVYWDRFTRRHSRDLLLVAYYVNRRALELETSFDLRPEQPLSLRETEAIALLAEGHSRARVAEMLAISEHTLRVYIEGARGKLQAQNTTHAVARAVAIGLISL